MQAALLGGAAMAALMAWNNPAAAACTVAGLTIIGNVSCDGDFPPPGQATIFKNAIKGFAAASTTSAGAKAIIIGNTVISGDAVAQATNGDVSVSVNGVIGGNASANGKSALVYGNKSGIGGNAAANATVGDALVDANQVVIGGNAVANAVNHASVSGNGIITLNAFASGASASINGNAAIGGTAAAKATAGDAQVIGNAGGIGGSAVALAPAGNASVSINGVIGGDASAIGQTALVYGNTGGIGGNATASATVGNAAVDANLVVIGGNAVASAVNGNASVSGNAVITKNATASGKTATINGNTAIGGSATANATAGNANIIGNGPIVGGATAIAVGGDVAVVNNGDITGTGIAAIASGAGKITISGNGAVTGAVHGIATSAQAGDTSINISKNVTGGSGSGINSTSTTGSIVTNIAAGVTIDPAVGVNQSTATGTILVSNGGVIAGTQIGVALTSTGAAPAGSLAIDNKATGTISGAGTAGIVMSSVDANQAVANAGTITGGPIGAQMATSGKGNIDFVQTGGVLTGTNNAFVGAAGGTGNIAISITGGAVGTTAAATIQTQATTGNTVITANVPISSSGGAGIQSSSTTGSITIAGTGKVAGTDGIVAQSSGAANITVAQGGDVVGTTGNGILAASNGGNVTVAPGANVAGATNGVTAVTAGAGKIDVTTIGQISGNTGAGVFTTNGAGPTTISNAGQISGVDAIAGGTAGGVYTIANAGTLNGAVNVSGANIAASNFTNDGIWNTGAGSSAFSGNLLNNNLISVAPGGSINIDGNTTNSAQMVYSGAGTFATSGKMANTGTINLQNGVAANNTVSVGGNYAGGGTLLVDTDTAAGKADRLAVTGTTSGVTTVNLGAVAQGLVPFTTVVTTGGTNAGDFVGTGAALNPIAGGLVTYSFIRDPGNLNNWGIKAQTNNAAIGGLTSLASSVATITTSFFEPTSNFVNAKPNPAENQHQWGIWARGSAAQYDVVNTTTVTGFGSADQKLRINYEAIQSGADFAVLNINGSKWNAHVGVTAGTITGTVKDQNVQTDLDAPFATIYGFVSNGAFTFDLSARKEWHDAEMRSSFFGDTLGHKVKGGADSVTGVATYRFAAANNWFLTPAVGLSYMRSHLDTFSAGGGAATVAAGSDEALIGQMALQLSYAWQVSPTQFIQPFVSAAAQRNFLDKTDADVTVANVLLPTTTQTVGDSMKYTVGLAGADVGLGLTGFVQGSWREGDRISGGSIMAGGRVNF